MNSEIIVSISCLTYNHGKYIRDTLEGFVKQVTNFKFQVLIHDDASTDDTVDIIKEYENKYPEIIKPIYQVENQYSKHVSIKKKYQIPRLKGKYVALCEGDDYWTDPYKLQKQVDFFEKNPEYTLCATSCVWRNLRDNIDESQFIIDVDKDIPVEDIIIEKNGRIFPTVSVMVKRDVYSSCPEWYSLFPVGDIALFINAGINGKIRMLSDVTCVYRWFSIGSWTSRTENEERKIVFKNKFIKGFEALNVGTEYKYDKAIRTRIYHEQFDTYVISRNWEQIKSKKYRDIWNSLSLMYKVNIYLRCRFPKLQKCIIMILRKVKGIWKI